jgi:hypothetical protein
MLAIHEAGTPKACVLQESLPCIPPGLMSIEKSEIRDG